MKVAKVIGSVSVSRKDAGLTGRTLLAVRYLDADMHETNKTAACIDTVGAGAGDIVLLCSSSSARFTAATRDTCADNAIVGIVDMISMAKKDLYHENDGALTSMNLVGSASAEAEQRTAYDLPTQSLTKKSRSTQNRTKNGGHK